MIGSKSGLIESTQINNNWHSLSNGKNVGGNLFLKGIYPEFQVIRGFSQKIPADLLSYDKIHS